MSFSFNSSNNINQFKAQAAYKDGGGMGGGDRAAAESE